MLLSALAIISAFIAVNVEGHGYLLTPPARGSAWRAGFPTPKDTNDMAMYCGGKGPQHSPANGGKCGVCGEEYSNPNKRLEPGPANKFATGTILGNYKQGETIDVTVVLTAYHKGYFEFRLCENDIPQIGKDASIAVTNECLDKHVLKSAKSGETSFIATPGKSTHQVVLPADVSCTACVFQWKYRCGNNWGCEDGTCGTGLGEQEHFVGCSDIAITPTNPTTQPDTTTVAPTSKETATTAVPTTTKPVTTAAPTTKSPVTTEAATTTEVPTTAEPTTDAPTTKAPATTDAPTTKAPATTEEPTTMEPTTEEPTTVEPSTTMKPTTTRPPVTTEAPTTPKVTPPVTKKPTTKKVVITTPKPVKPVKQTKQKLCTGSAPYIGMDYYCQINCNHVPPYCPPSHCKCSYV